MTLIYLTVAWLLGLVVGRAWAPEMVWLVVGAAGGLGLALAPGDQRRRLAGWCLAALVVGAGRYALSIASPGPEQLCYYNDQGAVVVEGFISAEPEFRGEYTQLEIAARSVAVNAQMHVVSGKALANVPVYPEYQYGDCVRVEANLQTPPMLDDFDYREYLASKGVHSLLHRPWVSRAPGADGSRILRWIYARKADLRDVIERILPGAEAGLLCGILLGQSHTLPDALYDAYRAAGLTHIIVISGFNIGLVAQAVMLVSQRLARRWLVLTSSLAVIALYTVFVGPSAPVVRATIMIGIALFGQLVGRKSHALTSLATATLIMTAANPLMLWSVSFQLSVVATLALIVLEPRLSGAVSGLLEARFPDSTGWMPFLRDTLIATVAAQVATLPIIWYHFRELSVVALPANLLALPVQPAILVLGALAAGLGATWLPAGRVVGLAVWPFLRWTNGVVELFGAPQWASVMLPKVAAGWFWAALGLVLVAVWLKPRLAKVRVVLAEWATGLGLAGLALATVVVWASLARCPDGRLHVRMLDIGQGDAILLTSPSGRRILVDGGPDPIVLAEQLSRALPPWDRRIDLVVATHSDKDHIGGLLALEAFRVGQAVESPIMSDSALYQAWRVMLADGGVPCLAADRGQRIVFDDGLWLEVVHPDAPADLGLDDNQGSVVLVAHYGAFHMLLTGDVDQDVEALLIERDAAQPVTALKVAHHGASSSTGDPWLDATMPQIALISAGQDNRFGHPCPDTLDRLEQHGCLVLRTDQQGACVLVTDGETVECETNKRTK